MVKPTFLKYPSIKNHDHPDIQNRLPYETDNVFVGVEKVHGANLQLTTDGETVWVGKRTAYVDGNIGFFNCELVAKKYSETVIQLHQLLDPQQSTSKDSEGKETVVEPFTTVYGEILGGNYPHEECKQLNVKKVQGNVFYTNQIEFLPFDVRTNDGLLAYGLMRKSIYKAGFEYLCPEVIRGTLSQVLNFDLESMQTLLPNMYGLPKLEGKTHSEGLVVRKVTDGRRFIFKWKRESFKEMTSRKGSCKGPKKDGPNSGQVRMIMRISEYVTFNRLDNVISHEGLDMKRHILADLFLTDAVDEFVSGHPELKDYVEEQSFNLHMRKKLIGKCYRIINQSGRL